MDQNNEPSKIVFESEEFQRPSQSFQTPTPKIVQWVIRYSGGYIKDEKQAQYVLFGVVAVVVVMSIYIAIPSASKGTIDHKPGDELLVPGVLNR